MTVTRFEPLSSESHMKDLTDFICNEQKRLSTGYNALDKALNGGLTGLVIIGGRPGTGKSAFALHTAVEVEHYFAACVYCDYEQR